MTINLEDLCSVKKADFDAIFNDYFQAESIDINANMTEKWLYPAYDLYKIHLKNPDNIDEFLFKLFQHIVTYWGQESNSLAKTNSIKYRKSKDLLTKYLDILKEKPLEELIEWINYVERNNKSSKYVIDADLEKLSKQRELWEILLFFFTESLLKSPIALSKIKLKTSNQIPVFWSDAIHISNCWRKIFFWESKLTDSFENWKEASRKSLIKFSWVNPLDHIHEEINVVGNNIDSINLDKKSILGGLISPYYNEETTQKPEYELVCFLWYQDEDYIAYLKDKNKGLYHDKLMKKIKNLWDYFWDKQIDLNKKHITFFLLPLVSIFNLLQKYWLKLRDEENLEIINWKIHE